MRVLKLSSQNQSLKFIQETNWQKIFITIQGDNYIQTKTIAYKVCCLLFSFPSLKSYSLFLAVQFSLRPVQYNDMLQGSTGEDLRFLKESV